MDDDKPDYKVTLSLPRTDFQMKARLPESEPEALARWEERGLYGKIMEAGRGRTKYILHDGPPYANGRIHMGHALNKVLKDLVVKSFFMLGYSTDYVPGWDCHGLPIELQVEKELKEKKLDLTKPEIRKRCRGYAERFVAIQREEFKRLGVFGVWEEPYLTMSYPYQAAILRELGKFVSRGLVYKGKKPVHWCSSCSTALAEAEVEYADKTSPSVYVTFEVPPGEAEKRLGVTLKGKTSIIIWTTTPWTLPANLAIALHPELEYALVSVGGENYILAEGLLEEVAGRIGWEGFEVVKKFYCREIEGLKAAHPFVKRDSVVLAGEHVTLEAGTGCVHIAPGHGQDDYELGLKYGLDIYTPVDDSGRFTNDVPEFEGQFVFKANAGIVELLKEKGALLLKEDIRHSYPHCWRCKNPIIFRATEQWFASMEAGELREKALEAITEKIEWIPAWGRDRIYNMVLNRPDWCLSRQRAWGVPIPALSCGACSKSFLDTGFISTLAGAFEEEGADIWFERELKDLPGSEEIKCPGCGGIELAKEEDILDVWFDSGVSFAAVLERRGNLKFPADLYLEGSDQHRGWFHSSLLASIGTRGVPPYEAALTHGFVVDGEGRKMSKSTGNVIAPQEVISKYGAEVLRLWVAAEDYREDIRISEEILKRLSEAYRRIRNTFRYILGNLFDFDPERDSVAYTELEELDRLTLHRLSRLSERVLGAYGKFEFHTIYHSVHNFCTVDLSAFYLDILKDRLYTRGASSPERRAAQTTIYHILDTLVRLTAPILVFTTDEAWSFMPGRRTESVHLSSMPEVPREWRDDGLEEKWTRLLAVKYEISKALEGARKDKIIGHSLDAKVSVYPPGEHGGLLKEEQKALEEILIISELTIPPPIKIAWEIFEGKNNVRKFKYESQEIPGLIVVIEKAPGQKCERCWHYSTTVGTHNEHPTVCVRCVEALGWKGRPARPPAAPGPFGDA
ncbi:MAG TPA: isoleucine--tRNA ligase [Thermodesulfobacteriota bacterium]|nr:isoleucine--tRNA ligase [Thermodesulfobacteriota bacterium]